jgi:putative transposase
MSFDSKIHHRKSIRLREHDYRQAGLYFITVCTHNRDCQFGEIVDGKMRLNAIGQIIHGIWNEIPIHFAHVSLDLFVVMPNHCHGILILSDDLLTSKMCRVVAPRDVWARHAVPQRPTPDCQEKFGSPVSGSIPTIIRSFKSECTKQINSFRSERKTKLWQCNYWGRVIRDDKELHALREYIENNPMQWHVDQLHPEKHEK